MTAPSTTLEAMVLLTATFALLLTLLAAPAVLVAFRRRVTASMNAASSMTAAPDEPPSAAVQSASGGSEGLLAPVDARTALAPAAMADRLLALADAKLRRAALAYAAGGLAHAAFCTLFFLGSFGMEFLESPALYLPVLAVFALPIVPTVAHVLGARPGAVAAWSLAGGVVVLLVAGDAAGLMLTVAKLHLLIPAVVFLVFNLRYWRGVAPLVLTLAAGGSLAWLLGLDLGRAAVGIDSPAIWTFRLGGFALGLGVALMAVRWLGTRYAAKATSDQELFLDGWWALFTVIQAALFMIRAESALMLASLVAFPAYHLTKRLVLRRLLPEGPAEPVPLLLLRVFGHDRRTERLLDGITRRWRCIGPVHLIAGPDLALRTVGPQDFYAFLSGRLSRAFVKQGEIGSRLEALDRRPDPDGRYRISQLFCHRDTWRAVLDALVERSAAVLMDLRGFDAERAGCSYELTRLGAHLGAKPVVLLADATTDWELVAALLRSGRPAAAASAQGYLLGTPKRAARLFGVAARLLLGAKPAGAG